METGGAFLMGDRDCKFVSMTVMASAPKASGRVEEMRRGCCEVGADPSMCCLEWVSYMIYPHPERFPITDPSLAPIRVPFVIVVVMVCVN